MIMYIQLACGSYGEDGGTVEGFLRLFLFLPTAPSEIPTPCPSYTS